MIKRFSNSEQKLPAIKRKNVILSIVLGVFFAFAFYSFSYLLREITRLFSITDKYNLWILSDQEMNFYNLFFAYLSLIFAQSFCLSQWFGKIRRPFEKVNIRKTAILNEQRFLNFFFLEWFAKLSFLYALFIGILGNGFYVFSFYPKYNFMFILMLIVLFSHTWITILRAYKRKAFKWMLFSAIIISVLAFSFSRINLVNYHKINEIVLNKNIAHKYKLELAEVDKFEYVFRVLSEIYVVNPSDTDELQNPLILFNERKLFFDGYGKELSFDDLEQNLLIYTEAMKEYLSSEYQIFTPFLLYIDKSIKMSFVNRLKEAMRNTEIYKIGYAVIPKNREYDKRYYTDYCLTWRLLNKEQPKNIDFHLKLSVSYFNDSVQINSIVYPQKDFYSKIKQEVENHDNYLIEFLVDDEMIFGEYILVLSEIKRAINAIRNEYSIKHYSTEYEILNEEDCKIIQRKIPIRLMEMSGK